MLLLSEAILQLVSPDPYYSEPSTGLEVEVDQHEEQRLGYLDECLRLLVCVEPLDELGHSTDTSHFEQPKDPHLRYIDRDEARAKEREEVGVEPKTHHIVVAYTLKVRYLLAFLIEEGRHEAENHVYDEDNINKAIEDGQPDPMPPLHSLNKD